MKQRYRKIVNREYLEFIRFCIYSTELKFYLQLDQLLNIDAKILITPAVIT